MVDQPVKVLMLGWEFPPQITGGLGTACEGMTRSLSKQGILIHFFMPHLFGNEKAPFLQLYDVGTGLSISGTKPPAKTKLVAYGKELTTSYIPTTDKLFIYGIPSYLAPYLRPHDGATTVAENREALVRDLQQRRQLLGLDTSRLPIVEENLEEVGVSTSTTEAARAAMIPVQQFHYGDSLFDEVARYAERALRLAKDLDFDLIHAHDWMTYPAALAIAKASGKPVILHIHSLESDRSGQWRNPLICEIERSHLQQATSVIAVSGYTRSKAIEEYSLDPDRVFVVHNGVTDRTRVLRQPRTGPGRVLFLGRVTFQKGPDYFVEAALEVLKHLPKTEFILAGSGDMLEHLRARTFSAGKQANFIFPGFLRGNQVDEIFATADLYVMPSVSEPFGISALEALYHDVPVIVSRQSGVSEVIRHALKADFWDVAELSDLMIGALKYPELRRDLVHMATQEMKRLDWDASAIQVCEVYRRTLPF